MLDGKKDMKKIKVKTLGSLSNSVGEQKVPNKWDFFI